MIYTNPTISLIWVSRKRKKGEGRRRKWRRKYRRKYELVEFHWVSKRGGGERVDLLRGLHDLRPQIGLGVWCGKEGEQTKSL